MGAPTVSSVSSAVAVPKSNMRMSSRAVWRKSCSWSICLLPANNAWSTRDLLGPYLHLLRNMTYHRHHTKRLERERDTIPAFQCLLMLVCWLCNELPRSSAHVIHTTRRTSDYPSPRLLDAGLESSQLRCPSLDSRFSGNGRMSDMSLDINSSVLRLCLVIETSATIVESCFQRLVLILPW